MPTFCEITTFPEPDPDENPWVSSPPPAENLEVVPSNPSWPSRFTDLARQITASLGSTVLSVEHVGSTAVPGLAAKDVIDIDLVVPDPRDEARYVSPLESLGYVLTVREPSFYEHRCLRLATPRVNLHVFGPDSPEAIRHRLFRDWLREHPDDRARYENAKRAATVGTEQVMDYNARKQEAVMGIYDRLFRAHGMIGAADPKH